MSTPRVCLVVPPEINYIPAPGTDIFRFSPLMCFASMATELRRHKLDVDIIDFRVNKNDLKNIVDTVASNYQICGLTTNLHAYSFVKEFSRKLKQKKEDILIVGGGPLISCIPKLIMDNTDIDVGVIGEGESAFLSIVENYSSSNFSNVAGEIIQNSTKYIVKSNRQSNNFNAFSPMALDIWPSIKKKITRSAYYESSRGCHYSCTFCSDPIKTYHEKSMELVKTELQRLKSDYDISHLFFVDPLFNCSPSRLDGLTRILNETSQTYECMLHINNLTKEALSKLKKSNCKRIWLGVESLSVSVQQSTNKCLSDKKIEKKVKLACDVGLETVCWFIVGLPGETEESLDAMLEFADKYPIIPRPNYLIPLPGTVYWKEAADKFFSKDELKLLEWFPKYGNGCSLLNVTRVPDNLLMSTYEKLYMLMTERFKKNNYVKNEKPNKETKLN